MTGPRIGSLFSGTGGLDMGVMAALGGSVAWHVEFDKAPSKILAHHWPDVPNLGDVTAVDWSRVEPVDVITGGFPCQDVSAAGKRLGLKEGTRSGLWHQMARAIQALRPSLVVIENVRGLLSARGAESDELDAAEFKVERLSAARRHIEEMRARAAKRGDVDRAQRLTTHAFRVMGQLKRAVDARRRAERRIVRAIGTVLGTLASLGYDAGWHGLRAADVGAPHGRFRVFVVAWRRTAAYPHDTANHRERARAQHRRRSKAAAHTPRLGHEWGRLARAGWAGSADGDLLPTPRATRGGSHTETVGLLPTPTSRDHKGPNQRGDTTCLHGALLPTPAVNDMGEGKTPDAWDEWTAKMRAAHGNGNGHGKSLAIEAQRLLPTPSVADVEGGRKHRSGERSDELLLNGIAAAQDWGIYADAIARWESLTRPAPAPTQPSKKGNPQLSAQFVEFLMGLPEGHVTSVPGLSRNDMLKALGNGVVPQQAEVAIRTILAHLAHKETA